jgi:hypothetical protein
VRSLRALALYAGLTVLLTWPLALHLRTIDPGDSAFFAWVMAWEIHALGTHPASLPHPNIFHPERYALGMDEPVLGTTVLALPIVPFTRDAVLIFHVVRLLTFLISAFTAYLLARDLECEEGPSLVAGAAFAFSPIRASQIAHLSTLGSQWLPLVLLFLYRFARRGRVQDAIWSGLWFVLTCYACGYHGLAGLVLLPLAALPLLWGRFHFLLRAIPALALVALGLAPLYALHRAALEPQHMVRTEAETILYSATLESFLAASPWNRLYGGLTASFRGSGNLFPGIVAPALAVAGAFTCWRERRRPTPAALSFAMMGLGAALYVLGPAIRVGGVTVGPGLMALLRVVSPVFTKIRVPARGAIYLALALAMLVGLVLRRLHRRPLVVALLGAAILAEGLIVPIPIAEWLEVVDSRRPPSEVDRWLAAQPEDFAIVELPIVAAGVPFRRPLYHDSIYMVRSTHHWKRLVNGYAGIEPVFYQQVREASQGFPSVACLDLLESASVRYVILHRHGYNPGHWSRIEADLALFSGRLREVTRFEDEVVLELLAARH